MKTHNFDMGDKVEIIKDYSAPYMNEKYKGTQVEGIICLLRLDKESVKVGDILTVEDWYPQSNDLVLCDNDGYAMDVPADHCKMHKRHKRNIQILIKKATIKNILTGNIECTK